MSLLIATVDKNQREQVQISLDSFKGHNLVAVRVFYDAGGGEMKPSKKGVSIRPDMLDGILDGLEAAKEEAIEKGWLV
tara:strand:+ start:93648 stop:93881 length:234 start_codon:yes stop_codon:yes gene_type:complete